MRLIDMLAAVNEGDDYATISKIEEALDKALLESGHRGRATTWTGDIAKVLVAEAPMPYKIAVRLITNKGGVSKNVYTYLVARELGKPHPGSMVLCPTPRGAHGKLWGLVQPDAAISGDDVLRQFDLKYIDSWVHRYSSTN